MRSQVESQLFVGYSLVFRSYQRRLMILSLVLSLYNVRLIQVLLDRLQKRAVRDFGLDACPQAVILHYLKFKHQT